MKLVTSSQMKLIDAKAISELKMPGFLLMENAANEVCNAIYSMESAATKRFAVIAGPGNNGGDGFAIARKLFSKNIFVKTIIFTNPNAFKGDCKTNYEILKNLGAKIVHIADAAALKSALTHCNVIVDAIFGTGLNSALDGIFKESVELINGLGKFVISVDIPSGLDADTGMPKDVAIVANMTVAFAYEKIGQALYPGRSYCGKLITADIGIPDSLSNDIGIDHFVVREQDAKQTIQLLRRKDNSHKADFGHVLVIAGSKGKTGAAVMAATAALRVGAGLVTMATPDSLHHVFQEKLTEVMTEPVNDTDGYFSEDSYDQIMNLLHGKSAVIIGPGISTQPSVKALVKRLVKNIAGVPIVIDADGLNIVSEDISILKSAKTDLILTPHPGEMSRLIGAQSKDVLSDKIGIARKFAGEHFLTLALKGGDTVIATKDGKIHINSSGSAVLSTAGTGDVLTGMIGGLLAQGLNPLNATMLGVYLHGATGDEIAGRFGKVGIIATDLLGVIPSVINKYLEGN